MPTIRLSKDQIDAALPKVAKGLGRYREIQRLIDAKDPLFRRRFNHFYRVRRNRVWREHFYNLLDTFNGSNLTFPEVLRALHVATDRYEASFASKLLATLRPEMPVIDSVVLSNLGLRLPAAKAPDRFDRICQLHADLASCFHEYLSTQGGRYLVRRFGETFRLEGDVAITEVKMLDLVLWQTRTRRPPN